MSEEIVKVETEQETTAPIVQQPQEEDLEKKTFQNLPENTDEEAAKETSNSEKGGYGRYKKLF